MIDFWATIFRAPNDCLQYLTGKTNRFKSFNGNTAQGMIQTQMYTVCIRRECGYCAMDVSESFVTTTSDPDPFDLHPQTADTALVGTDCTNTFVSIFVGLSDQNTDTKSDKFCGRRLGSKDGNTVSGTVRSNDYIHLGSKVLTCIYKIRGCKIQDISTRIKVSV